MDQTQNLGVQSVQPQKSKKKVILITLLTFIFVSGLVAGTYTYQQSKINKLKEESVLASSQLKTAEAKLKEVSEISATAQTKASQTNSPAVSKDDELLKTVRAYSIGRKMGFGNSTAYTISSKKSVGDLTSVGLNYKNDEGSSCCRMLLKNVENRWILVTDISIVNPVGDAERELQINELTQLGVPKGQGLVGGDW